MYVWNKIFRLGLNKEQWDYQTFYLAVKMKKKISHTIPFIMPAHGSLGQFTKHKELGQSLTVNM